jgi:hypothetical protein
MLANFTGYVNQVSILLSRNTIEYRHLKHCRKLAAIQKVPYFDGGLDGAGRSGVTQFNQG